MNLLKPKKAALLNSTILILIGIIGYYYNSTSITALIPVFLGAGIFLCYCFMIKIITNINRFIVIPFYFLKVTKSKA